jgi:FkbM family methyltransferase
MFGTFGGGGPGGSSGGGGGGGFGGGTAPGGFAGAAPPGIDRVLSELAGRTASLAADAVTVFTLLGDARRRIARIEANAALAAAGRTPRMPVEFRSQFGEDALLWSLFEGQLDGFFIEVGAFDGYSLSTTYAFEAMGWNGLLVEALPASCSACAERRKFSRVVNSALGRRGSGGTTTFTVVDDDHGGMLSYHTTDQTHMEMLRRGQMLRKAVTVPLTTMDALLESHPGGPPTVDFATIDVEGGEPDLMDGFDLARWKPKVLIIEDNSRGGSKPGHDLAQKVVRAGYTHLGWLFINGVYVRNDAGDILARGKSLFTP